MTHPKIKETCKIFYGSWDDCFKRYKKIVALQKKKHQDLITLQLDIQDNPHMDERSSKAVHKSSNVLVWRYGYTTS